VKQEISEAQISPVGPHALVVRPPWMEGVEAGEPAPSGSHRLEPLRVANLLHALAAEVTGRGLEPVR
jgi:hypothetical protein